MDIPDEETYLVVSDEQRIIQVVLNLLSNALKFTSKVGKIIIVCSLVRENDHFLQISVEDTGIGISEEDQAKLFKLFGYLTSSQS